MREILFRSKRKNDGKWVYGFYLNRSNDKEDIHCIMEKFPATKGQHVMPETVGQYTGLTDKNGKKIFEGDILNCHSLDGVNDFRNRIVVWSELFLCFKADKPLYGDGLQIYEVIGNIHDNPELVNLEELNDGNL